jgi:hypothetical protein
MHKSIFALTEIEENELYDKCFKNVKCPNRYHTDERRIWWIENYKPHQTYFSYSVCQSCYHNKHDTILKQNKNLVPVFSSGVQFNCDMSAISDSYNVELMDGWLLGVYHISDQYHQLLPCSINNDNKYIKVIVPSFGINIGLCLYKQTNNTISYTIKVKSNSDDIEGVHVSSAFPIDNEFNITVDKLKTEKPSNKPSNKVLNSVFLYSPDMLQKVNDIPLVANQIASSYILSIISSEPVFINPKYDGLKLPLFKSNVETHLNETIYTIFFEQNQMDQNDDDDHYEFQLDETINL